MAVPKRKTTRSKRDMRRANHDRVTPPNAIPCPSCGDMMLPHRVCPACGSYKGRKVVGQADDTKTEAAPASE